MEGTREMSVCIVVSRHGKGTIDRNVTISEGKDVLLGNTYVKHEERDG